MKQNEHQYDEFLSLKEKFGADVVKIDKISIILTWMRNGSLRTRTDL